MPEEPFIELNPIESDLSRRMQAFDELIQRSSHALSAEDVLELISAYILKVVRSDRASLILLSEDSKKGRIYSLEANAADRGQLDRGLEFPLGDFAIWVAIDRRKLHIWQDLHLHRYADFEALATLGYRTAMHAPLITSGRVIGTLNTARRATEAYSLLDQGLMGALASFLAAIIVNRRLFKEKESIIRELAAAKAEAEQARTLEESARQRAENANRTKDEFMGIAAHDLRSPLNAVKGYSEMILEDPGLGAETRDLAVRIHSAADRMSNMVENLLEVNRIERGDFAVNLVLCDLAPLVTEILGVQRSQAVAKLQQIHYEADATIGPAYVDPAIVVQILENLVSNAIKYSALEGRIHVRLYGQEGAVCFEVRDEGPGLSTEDQRRLFGSFARLSAKPTGGEKSTGLGLSITKRLVEALNGRIWCTSELGKGATFGVAFPVSCNAHAP